MDGPAANVRFASPDVLKGIIIVLVVLVHIVLLANTGSEEGRTKPLVMQILYLSLMAFFLMSGYFYRPGRSITENIKKRVLQLLVALIVCSVALPVIAYCWLALMGQASDISDIFDAFIESMYLNDLFVKAGLDPTHAACCTSIGYYYPWTMMGGFLIFYTIANYVMEDYKKIAVAIAALLGVTALIMIFWDVKMPFQVHLAPIAACFMLIGATLAKVNLLDKVESLEWRSGRYWLPLAVCLVVGVGLSFLSPPGVKFDYLEFGDYGVWSLFPYVVEAVCMFVVYLYLAKLLSMVPVLSKLITIAGQHSLGILLLHGFIATMILAPFFIIPTTTWFPTDMTMVQRVIVAFATLILCIVISRYGPKALSRIRGKEAESRVRHRFKVLTGPLPRKDCEYIRGNRIGIGDCGVYAMSLHPLHESNE